MAKDPGFIFYPGDYLRDTQCLSEKSQVAYDRIMCEHMRNTLISKKQFDFFTKKLTDDEKEELLMTLTELEGSYQISWVVESITKRKAFTESRRNSRLKSDEDNVRIYIVRDNVRSIYKIGSSVNPIRRYNELNNQKNPAIMGDDQNNRDLTLIWYSDKVKRLVETKLHNTFKIKNLYGEWFSLIKSDIIEIIKAYGGVTYDKTYVERTENEIENDNNSIVDSNKEGINNLGKENFEKEIVHVKSKKNFPVYSDFNGLPELNVNTSIELIRITQNATVSKSDIDSLWNVFKVQNLTGEKYYHSEKEVYSHFTNWVKNQKIQVENILKTNKNEKLGTSTARMEKIRTMLGQH